MRIVVTGATGNVGTSVIGALRSDPRVTEIVGVARRVPGREGAKVVWRSADVRSSDLVALFRGAAAVIHLAWQIQPSRARTRLDAVNVEGSKRVMRAVEQARVGALVFASSVGVYAPGASGAVTERWTATGIATSHYSRQKVQVERLLDEFEEEHPEIRVVRLRKALVFKREAASEIGRLFVGRLALAVLRRGGIPVVPMPRDLVIQVVHSLDAGEAYRRAALEPVSGAFNVAAEPLLDASAIARVARTRVVAVPRALVRAAVSASYRLRAQPTDPGWVDLMFQAPTMATGHARETLGWTPRYPADVAFGELLDGIRRGAGADTVPLWPLPGGEFVRSRM